MGAQVCKCNKSELGLGQLELRGRDNWDSVDSGLFATLPAHSFDEVHAGNICRGGVDQGVQCKLLGDSRRSIHGKTESGSIDLDPWNTEKYSDDVAAERQGILDTTLHTSHSMMGIDICDKPERPVVSTPPLAFTVATGKHDDDHGGLYEKVEEADVNSCASTQEQEQAEEAASAFTFPAGSSPETDSGDSISRRSQDVVHANVQVDDGTTTDAIITKAPATWLEDTTSITAPTDGTEDATSTTTPTDEIEANPDASADMGTIAAPAVAAVAASRMKEATSTKAPTDGIEDLDQTRPSSANASTDGTEDATSIRAPANWVESSAVTVDSVSARVPADQADVLPCTNPVGASPAAAVLAGGRELCHISEWYHRVQVVEEVQSELPPLKTPAQEFQAQESKHSPKLSPRQPQQQPKKSPSRKSGTAQRASRAEDIMLW